ncbi:hypothetical protein ACVWYQ_003127 [Bradyrhizobium sp. USDA 3397]
MTATKANSLNRGDKRLWKIGDVPPRRTSRGIVDCLKPALLHLLDVGPGREKRFVPAKDDATNILIGRGTPQSRCKLRDQIVAQGVSFRRPVQRRNAHMGLRSGRVDEIGLLRH